MGMQTKNAESSRSLNTCGDTGEVSASARPFAFTHHDEKRGDGTRDGVMMCLYAAMTRVAWRVLALHSLQGSGREHGVRSVLPYGQSVCRGDDGVDLGSCPI